MKDMTIKMTRPYSESENILINVLAEPVNI